MQLKHCDELLSQYKHETVQRTSMQ